MGPKPSSNERKDLIFSPTTTIISIRCVFKRMGSLFSGTKNWGVWTASKKKDHINALELKAAKHAILISICMYLKVESIHIQMDDIVALLLSVII